MSNETNVAIRVLVGIVGGIVVYGILLTAWVVPTVWVALGLAGVVAPATPSIWAYAVMVWVLSVPILAYGIAFSLRWLWRLGSEESV